MNQPAPALDHVYDVIVVGAGMGGLYGVKRFRDQGLDVLGLEAAPEVGGVWYHNGYPGARVDVESLFYCYYFDPELYRSWKWTEKLAIQPELLAYLKHVADHYDLRRSILFDNRVDSGVWDPEAGVWRVTTEAGGRFAARYLVMATGQLSRSRKPPYAGLDDFEGEWVLSSDWHDVAIDDKRVAVMGTGSSGVQAVTAISKRAAHTYVLQRTPGYVVPIKNGPFDDAEHQGVIDTLDEVWDWMLNSGSGLGGLDPVGKAADFSPEEQQRIMEERWQNRPFDVFSSFSDLATDAAANEVVSEFVRRKSEALIDDPELRPKLVNRLYPIGARRVVFASGYYESFNQDNVTLVDIAEDPVDRFLPSGVRLRSGREIELDTVVFAIGFEAFMGAIKGAGIRNEHGAGPSDHWTRGPQTYLGYMTRGFPNFFIATGPGSPATLSSNMNLSNVHDMNWFGDLFAFMAERGYQRVEPGDEAIAAWSAHVQDVAKDHLRLQDDNYMVQVLDDGTRVLIPYIGGVGEYVRSAARIAANDYEGFEFA
jgi:cation diffusion facilitator CzcD-associated flavoprotein CzcO